MPVASVVVIDYGQIIAVGGEELLRAFAAGHKHDLAPRGLGRTTDAHLHLKHYALALQKINCETDTIEGMFAQSERTSWQERSLRMDPGARLES